MTYYKIPGLFDHGALTKTQCLAVFTILDALGEHGYHTEEVTQEALNYDPKLPYSDTEVLEMMKMHSESCIIAEHGVYDPQWYDEDIA